MECLLFAQAEPKKTKDDGYDEYEDDFEVCGHILCYVYVLFAFLQLCC